MEAVTERERVPEPSNPMGMDGIEFIELATSNHCAGLSGW
jgi:4-hydroxyphenylpyruvate dioxygenase-like putative hemolysin